MNFTGPVGSWVVTHMHGRSLGHYGTQVDYEVVLQLYGTGTGGMTHYEQKTEKLAKVGNSM